MKKIIVYSLVLGLVVSSCKQEQKTTETEVEVVNTTEENLKSALTLYSSFDTNANADFAKGDSKLYTVLNRRELDSAKAGLFKEGVTLQDAKGKYGGALHYADKTKGYIYYRSLDNIEYSKSDWSGSISFWLQLDPDKDLKPGYCDPIQITDSGYNDAGIWVDFTKTLPRQFRLGVIGDRDAWNPKPEGPDNENPKFLEQLITAKDAPFGNDKWTHVTIVFSNLNTENGKTEFYVNGNNMGSSTIAESFTWDYEKSNILLGLSYIGFIDDLSIYNKALSPKEIQTLYGLDNGVKTILN